MFDSSLVEIAQAKYASVVLKRDFRLLSHRSAQPPLYVNEAPKMDMGFKFFLLWDCKNI